MSTSNERAHPRAKVDAFVRIVGADREYAFRTRDLSEGGVFLHTRVGHLYPFAAGAEVQIELQDGDRVVSLRGVIARVVAPSTPEASEYPSGFALKLVDLDDAQRAALRALLAQAR